MINDLKMRNLCAKIIPKLLTDEEQANRLTILNELPERVLIEPDKRQSDNWSTVMFPEQKKIKMNKSRVKAKEVVFFSAKGHDHKEFVFPGQIVNAVYNVEVLERLRKRIL